MSRRKKLTNNSGIPQHEIENIARILLPDILAFYESEEGQREFAEWKKQREADEKMAAQRKLQVGTGDRSERIRTYNYPQSRVSDHRIGLTLYKLDAILDGDLDELIDALLTFEQTEKLQQQQEEF